MTTLPVTKSLNKPSRTNIFVVLIPVVGAMFALLVAGLLIRYWLNMDNEFVISMVTPLAAGAAVSLVVALVLYFISLYFSPSLRLTFLFITIIVAALTLTNGLVAAQQMFTDTVVLIDTTILLLFTTIVAGTFGMGGFLRVTSGLRQLMHLAHRVASGDYQSRVIVDGRDELAQLGTSFNEMATQLESAAQEREELAKMRRDLTAWVSHDLRTPLTSMRAMVEALNDGLVEDPEQVKRYYRLILGDVQGMNRLINDLFEMSRLDAGGMKIEMEEDSLSDLISDSIGMFDALAKQRNIKLIGDVAPKLDSVRMNARKIGRVLANLISNALKYTPDNGTIRVEAWRDDAAVYVSVQDSGNGFAEKDIPLLFEQFYRGEGARSRSGGSSAGLGLSIARGIVEAHGGMISAENQNGARITFTLPQ